jgi:hypothetical protein
MAEQTLVQVPQEAARMIESALQKAEEKIIKVAENHGKVQRMLKDAAGVDVIVSEFDYGGDFIYQRLVGIDAELLRWQDGKWIDQQIANLTAQRDKILAMKAVLEGK